MIETLKPYPAYKATELPWFPDVPAHWQSTRLRSHLTRNDSGVWGEVGDDGTVVLRSTEQTIDGGWRITEPAKVRLSPAQSRAAKLLAGDLVVTKSSGSASHIGKTSLVTPAIEEAGAAFSNFMQRLRVDNSALPQFVWFLLNSPLGREQLVWQSTTTTGLGNLSGTILGNCIFPFPPVDEQRAIVRYLDHMDRRIRRFVAAKKKLIALLNEQKQAIIHRAVTRGLDPTVPLKPSGVEWLGDIPRHWDVVRVKHVARMESGHTPSRSNPEHWLDTNDIPWVSLNDTKQLDRVDYISETRLYINALGIQNSSARILPAGVVVFTRDAAVGKAAITTRPMAVSQHLIAWICGPRITNAYLLRVFYAMKAELQRFTFGATIATIGMDDVRKLVTPVPPLDEQNAIAQHVEDACHAVNRTLEVVSQELEAVRGFRTRLISDVVTGKLDIREVAARLPEEAEDSAEQEEGIDDTSDDEAALPEEEDALA